MNAMPGAIEEVDRWLRRDKHVRVDKEWLEACTEWLREQHSASVGIPELREKIYEQWLYSDLRECGEAFLPSDLKSVEPQTLNSLFCLQINSVLNVGAPAYSQLLQMRGQEIKDEEESTSSHVKVTNSRMLFLEVTDGEQTLNAMEYKPVGLVLSEHTPPGTKILIKGPVQCRLGAILLTSDCLEVLGGQVEGLLEKNSISKVLSRAIGREDVGQSSSITPAATVAGIPSRGLMTISEPTPGSSTLSGRSQHGTQTSGLGPDGQTAGSFGTLHSGGGRMPVEQQDGGGASHDDHMEVDDIGLFEVDDWDDLDLDSLDEDMLESGNHGSIPDEVHPTPPPSNLREGGRVHSSPDPQSPMLTEKISSSVRDVYEVGSEKSKSVEGDHHNPILLDDSPEVQTKIAVPPSNLDPGPPNAVQTLTVDRFKAEGSLVHGTVKIRAKCVGTVQKLTDENNLWSLHVQIEDATGSMTVCLSNEILEEIIGFSAVYFKHSIEPLGTTDKAMKAIARQGFKRCQYTLSQLNCWMEVGVVSGSPHPLVTKLF